jgi:hypothetical protein
MAAGETGGLLPYMQVCRKQLPGACFYQKMKNFDKKVGIEALVTPKYLLFLKSNMSRGGFFVCMSVYCQHHGYIIACMENLRKGLSLYLLRRRQAARPALCDAFSLYS